MRLRLQNPFLLRALKVLSRLSWGAPGVAAVSRGLFAGCKADFVIGVDTLGIVGAERLAGLRGVRFALISYELLFEEETGPAWKVQERRACQGIEFAVVQDPVRGAHLARENAVDPGKMYYMPVAASGEVPVEKGWLRQHLGIPKDRKIAIQIGSTDDWTGFAQLVKSAPDWPEDWCLVVHHRYGTGADLGRWVDGASLRHVYVSEDSVPTSKDLGRILGDADLGIALYFPDYRSVVTGRNLEHIGMASGKIATFLQFGVPVLTNEIGEMADHVRAQGLGQVVASVEDIPGVLAARSSKDENTARRCRDFFDRALDIRRTGEKVFAAIDEICR